MVCPLLAYGKIKIYPIVLTYTQVRVLEGARHDGRRLATHSAPFCFHISATPSITVESATIYTCALGHLSPSDKQIRVTGKDTIPINIDQRQHFGLKHSYQ